MHQGYLSEEAKRAFSIRAGILGAVFFFLQFIVPFLIMVPLMFTGSMFMAANMEVLEAGKAISFGQGLLVPSAQVGFPGKGQAHAVVYVTSNDSEQVLSVSESPWLVRSGTTTYCFTRSVLYSYDGGRWAPVSNNFPFALIADVQPYMDGLVVRTVDPDDTQIHVAYVDGKWSRLFGWPESSNRNDHVSTYHDSVYRFRRQNDRLFVKVNETGEWQSVGNVTRRTWAPCEFNDTLYIIALNSDLGANPQVWRLVDDSWQPAPVEGLPRFVESARFIPRSNDVDIVTSGFPGSLSWYRYDGAGAERLARRSGSFFPAMFGWIALVPQTANLIMPLLLALCLTLMMRRYRVAEYISETGSAFYAPLVRRALAEIIDMLIVALPAGIVFLTFGLPLAFFDTEQSPLSFFAFPFIMVGVMFCLCGFGIVMLVVYSFLEGRYCLTPGKWLLGIRVVGTDLRPCGFGRALLRNILRFVDGFFNYLVGIMLVAFTENQQRVGDFAARTIVVRKAGLEKPGEGS